MEALFCENKKDDYYALLGCTELSSLEQIDTEYKVRVRECHPDKVTDPEMKSKAEVTFMSLNKAHSILKDPESRNVYDKWRRSGLKISFEQFQELQARFRSSMHWTSQAKQPAIATAEMDQVVEGRRQSTDTNHNHLSQFRSNQQSTSADLLSRFRTYRM